MLVGALDTDVASAQAAAEAQLHNLLRRNRLAEAAAVARDARIRSIQYGAEVKRCIVETKRDVLRAGWSGEVPKRGSTSNRECLHRFASGETTLIEKTCRSKRPS